MKNLKKQLAGFTILLLSIAVLFWYINKSENQEITNIIETQSVIENQTPPDEYVIDQSDFIEGNELIKDIPESQLSNEEIDGLVLMREEEKLARDVYNTLGEKWGMQIFTNIAKSEQTHTDAIKVLLDRYEIEDPVKDDSVGVFTSFELDELYQNLLEQGNLSLLDALTVGAIVEDLDIKDLNELSAKTNNADIIATYNNLNKGSRNHLRAFMRLIENNNGSYIPQYISQTEFDDIISSEQEKGRAR
ncbi:MAG: DUF2202 domain-containing protein [Candidatus Pacebacteria bacterium]|nr:DUF2202 domain-containing protein [Candidatus Paceibacterota bacterium]